MFSIRKSDLRVMILMVVVATTTVCVMLVVDALQSNDISAVLGENDSVKSSLVNDGKMVTNPDGQKAELSSFDPNTVDSLTLLKYGLGPTQIRSLMGYRRHNGTFDSPLAVSKLYNWSDADVEKVLPYIVIDEKYKKTYKYREEYYAEERLREERTHQNNEGKYHEGNNQKYHEDKGGRQSGEAERKYPLTNKFSTLTKVDINEADTALLKRIPGVGTGIANAIVKLRGKLGGFYSTEQLSAIEYISPELYEWFEVKPKADLHLININKATFQVLNAHPYITYNQARDLMNYRRLYGIIKDLNALSSINIFSKEEIERLSPYLEF